MIYTMDDIKALLRSATAQERKELAALLGYQFESINMQAEELVKQLAWKYQTPLGYLMRTQTFDEMCVDVAKQLKFGKLTKQQVSCWDLLDQVIKGMLEKMIREMTPDQKEQFAKALFSDEKIREAFDKGGYKGGKFAAGSLLTVVRTTFGFAPYPFTLIVVNQVARILLGRGLSLAANVVVVRTVSFILGPVGWLLLIWGINDLLGTNYKKVIPATLYIYCIYARLKEEGKLPFN